MRLQIKVRSVPTVSIEERHKKFVESLIDFKGPWGLPAGEYPPPDPEKDLCAIFPVGNFLPKGVKGTMLYTFRGSLQNVSDYDDILDVDFDPHRFEMEPIVTETFPLYCISMDAYHGFIGAEQYIYEDFKKSRGFNYRDGVLRVYEVNYFSYSYLAHVAVAPLEEMVSTLKLCGLEATMLDQGVLLRAPQTPLALQDGNLLNSCAIGCFKPAGHAGFTYRNV